MLNLKNITIPNLDLTNYSALSNIPLITFSAYPFSSTNIPPFIHTTNANVSGTIVNTTNNNEIDKNSIHQSAQLSNFGQYTVYNTTTGKYNYMFIYSNEKSVI